MCHHHGRLSSDSPGTWDPDCQKWDLLSNLSVPASGCLRSQVKKALSFDLEVFGASAQLRQILELVNLYRLFAARGSQQQGEPFGGVHGLSVKTSVERPEDFGGIPALLRQTLSLTYRGKALDVGKHDGELLRIQAAKQGAMKPHSKKHETGTGLNQPSWKNCSKFGRGTIAPVDGKGTCRPTTYKE